MKAASSSEIKAALKQQTPTQLIEVCLRLARFKKENKELLTYLLFESDDRASYIQNVKNEISDRFAEINTSSIFYAKKSLRKILRNANKFIRYSGDELVETEVLLHYATLMKEMNLSWRRSNLLMNLYKGVLKKTEGAIAGLHEDLQYEYLRTFRSLVL